jgi:NgoFVII restriction endonuclease
MSLIYSNYPPLKTESDTYHEAFTKLLELSDYLKIASGYISADALIDLRSIVEINGGPRIQLNIGMHYFEGLTKQQKEAVEGLDTTLRNMSLGGVFFVKTFPFHGKLISFSKNQVNLGSLIGSSNLTNIVKDKSTRQYEVDYLLSSKDAIEIDDFITKLNETATKPFNELDIKTVESRNTLLDDQYGVAKVDQAKLIKIKADLKFDFTFEVPLKADEATKSNLNTFNGKGRENQQKFVMPRSWYEVELIVPKSIATLRGYPQSDKAGDGGVIDVITDDGWEFSCKISGQNSKNLRSEKDLKILGKWLKGRLEHAGALKTGELCTSETFDKYGRSTFTLAKISNSDKWYLDFEVNK